MKFTRSGNVKIKAKYLMIDDKILIKIIDTGIGISKKNLKLIFELFGKNIALVKNINSHGSGLGLTISNLII